MLITVETTEPMFDLTLSLSIGEAEALRTMVVQYSDGQQSVWESAVHNIPCCGISVALLGNGV